MPINYDELGNVIYSTSDEVAKKPTMPPIGERAIPGVPPGAVPRLPTPPIINFVNAQGASTQDDLRVRILVPPKYMTPMVSGPNDELANIGGILFPYTPTISFEAKADYSSSTPLHSNFPINFYQRSSIGNITISGKFSVENADDAEIYLATMHLLKALTRMRSGGEYGDPDSGAPPPVCRLFAAGEGMLHDVPVAISNFRIEFPDSVDYFSVLKNYYFGTTSVPTISTFAVTCIPMYSRAEMQGFSVSKYVSGGYRKKGYI